jgi:serine-type D-Ala-D-Ala carboxypeptidase/endopeptidase (penicillin-binding protein 4)
MNKKALTVMVAGSLLMAACSSTAPPKKPEPRFQFQALADSIIILGLPEVHWGILVWDQARNTPIYSYDSQRHFIPASNTKIIPTSVALGLLGPDWRYQTPFMTTTDSVPSLVVKGSGDPTWSRVFYPNDYTVIDMLADSVVAKGIKRIGDLVVDASAFGGEHIHGAWEIGDLPWYYAAPTGALAIGDGNIPIVATSSATGTELRAINGNLPMPVRLQIRMDTARARPNLDIDYQLWPDTLVMFGSIGPNSADTSRIAIPNQEMYAANALADALRRKGVTVNGKVRVVRDSVSVAGLRAPNALFTWYSLPLKDIIPALLGPSDNWIAEQLLKTLGAVRGNGGTWRGGLNVERRYLIDVAHVDSLAFSLSDGSGLSAQNLVSPLAFVTLLESNRKSAWGQAYYDALPRPGMRRTYGTGVERISGTLSSRLQGLETRLAAKTGTIANVATLSGYLKTELGRDITFSIMTKGAHPRRFVARWTPSRKPSRGKRTGTNGRARLGRTQACQNAQHEIREGLATHFPERSARLGSYHHYWHCHDRCAAICDDRCYEVRRQWH